MQISMKIVNLVIITLIYVSVIESQPYRGGNGFPIDDIVAAIATAAMNGALPLHKMGLGNPNRKGDGPLRIPILLIRPNDLKGIKSGKMKFSSNDRPVWNGREGGPRNGRDFYKKNYSPKPKFPTHGLKVVPAPKLEMEKRKNFEKKIMAPMGPKLIERDRDLNEERFGENRNQFNQRLNEEKNNRNRLNNQNYHQKGERFNDKQLNETPRLPLRQSDHIQDKNPNTFELPEKESDRPLEEDDYDYRGGDSLPPPPLPTLKPVIKVPTIVRHVYGAKAPNDNEKPTIPPRYLKGMSDIPSPSSSSQGKYDDESDDSQQSTHSRIPAYNHILPPIHEQYKAEPVVSHKSVYLGDVYRKANSEEEEEPRVSSVQTYSNTGSSFGNSGPSYTSSVQSYNPSSVTTYTNSGGQSYGQSGSSGSSYGSNRSPYGSSVSLIPGSAQSSPQEEVVEDDESGPLAGYAKDQYDKQLVSTLTKLMANSKNRGLNIGGLESGGSDAKQTDKPVTKTTTKYYSAVQSPQKTSFRDNFFQQKSQSNYNSNYKESIPQSQYPSQIQSNSQSRIPESYLTPISMTPARTHSSSDSQGQLTQNQGTELIRKPVSLDLDYNSGGRQPEFDDVAEEYSSQTYPTKA